jgi:hypothetical protein
VAFLRNEERNVFLAMHGLPRPPEGVEFGRPLPKAVVRSVPLVLLADAGTRMSTGALCSAQSLPRVRSDTGLPDGQSPVKRLCVSQADDMVRSLAFVIKQQTSERARLHGTRKCV